MIKKLLLLLLSLSLSLLSSPVVPNESYFIDKSDKKIVYVYSKEYQPIIPSIKKYQKAVINTYEKEFGYELDEKIYVGLASSSNQIANGYSTQIPFNSQIHYNGGAYILDYFSTSSWLKTLLIHETAHNFQLNAKENTLSQFSHSIVGNTPFAIFGFYPFFPLPNLYISRFLLEGNAVLNESRFGIGGRLFSGYALAQTVLLAKDNKLTQDFLINDILLYPYGEHFYLTGGLFQAFLAQKYGVKKVNLFFKKYSQQYFPFFLNRVFKKHFGKSFNYLIKAFNYDILTKHQGFQKSQGKIIARSKLYLPLSRKKDEIFTLISNHYASPQILSLKKDKISFTSRSFPLGQLFKKDHKYYVQSSRNISPTQIIMGLYDDTASLLPSTHSKVVQGFLPTGEMLYININRSIDSPHLYINHKFYDNANSVAYVSDRGDIYYFKQTHKKRTLYKNKKPIFTFEGYYGYVVEVGKAGEIYFISTSKHGTTLYQYYQDRLTRITQGDDVVDMKLISSDKMILETLTAKGIVYKINSFTSTHQETSIATYHYHFEENNTTLLLDNQNFTSQKIQKQPEKYHPITQFKYTSLAQNISYDKAGLYASINANFSDPLQQNSLSLFIATYPQYNISSMFYNNSAYLLNFGASLSLLFNQNRTSIKEDRNYGYSLYAKYPFLSSGYFRGEVLAQYNYPFYSIYQKPFTLAFSIQKKKKFFLSKYSNLLHQFSLFASQDRDTLITGMNYNFMHDLPYQSYFGINAKALNASLINPSLEKGIEVTNEWMSLVNPYTSINIPSLSYNFYVNRSSRLEVSFYKVFDAYFYSSWSSFSLQRESIYIKQRLYYFKSENEYLNYQESIVGIELDLLIANETKVPLSIEWIHNDKAVKKDILRFGTTLNF